MSLRLAEEAELVWKSFLVLIEPQGGRWNRLKWISILGSYLLMMFYTMVSGWMLYYAYRMAAGKLSGLDSAGVSEAFYEMLGNAPLLAVWMIAAVVVSFSVCAMGLRNGVEKITKVMMSLLIVLIVALAINSLLLPGALEGIRFYLVPDFALVNSRASAWLFMPQCRRHFLL